MSDLYFVIGDDGPLSQHLDDPRWRPTHHNWAQYFVGYADYDETVKAAQVLLLEGHSEVVIRKGSDYDHLEDDILYHAGGEFLVRDKRRQPVDEPERLRSETAELRAIVEEIARDGAKMTAHRLDTLARYARALLGIGELPQ